MLRVFAISCLLFFISLSVVEGSEAYVPVKIGDRLRIDSFTKSHAIQREVPAGTQIWNFDGKNAGYFVNENGKKIVMDYSNYEQTPERELIIKKVRKSDLGMYQAYPIKPITIKHADGTVSEVSPPVLSIEESS